MLRIENDHWIALINPEQGAELASLRLVEENLELLYRAGDYRPIAGWQGRAPLLWPAVGRNFTARQLEEICTGHGDSRLGSYRYGDREYPMPIHGFVNKLTWQPKTLTPTEVTLAAEDDANSRVFFPFGFRVMCRYLLRAASLLLEVEVSAKEEVLPFSIGNHITVAVPCAYDHVLLATPARKRMLLSPWGLLTGEELPVDYSLPTPFVQMDLADGVLGGYCQDQCFVDLQLGTHRFRIGQRAWSSRPSLLKDEDFLFVFYASKEKGFICPEPWLGRPNSFNIGEGLILLPPGEKFSWEMEVAFLGTHR